jgi:excinuclease ABC subunit C
MDKERLKLIPHLPGSYQYYNKDGIIIYVGKAKDLHNRVNSYFIGKKSGKTKMLVDEIQDFKYVITSSELEAFIVELNLIKKYDPKYNILLRDDKSYPYIEYINKPYPLLKVSRYLNIKKKDNKILFGPFPNQGAARRVVNLINRLYPLKKCNGSEKKVCLYYHIGECLGYCQHLENKSDIESMENEILSFLRGNDEILRKRILNKIDEYSSNLNYEMALELTNDLKYIDVIMAKQKVELHDFIDRDIWGLYFNHGHISINILFIRNNKLINSYNDILTVMDDYITDMDTYIVNFYNKHEIPKEILLPNEGLNISNIENLIKSNIYVPKKGNKKKLIDMAYTNSYDYLENNIKLISRKEETTVGANKSLANLLNMEYINRIDLFDNSNLFGAFSVSGMVVYKNGLPAKKEYRKYKISIDKNDDYNTMKEVITRRYERAIKENTELPDLIIVDGGETQIKACKEVLKSLNLDIMVCGLKKNEHHRTNELVNGKNMLTYKIDKDSNLFLYLTSMQDEVHNFTINYHKSIRSKGSISSILDNIEGIGNVRKKELIKKYKNINNIKNASIEELNLILPLSVSKNLKKYLENYKNNS